jgi:hypothetical protein
MTFPFRFIRQYLAYAVRHALSPFYIAITRLNFVVLTIIGRHDLSPSLLTVQETRRMSSPPIRHLSLRAVGLLGLSLTSNVSSDYSYDRATTQQRQHSRPLLTYVRGARGKFPQQLILT